ncbi:MAG: HAD-IA family hydrolase [Candidatus Andersenbacteria bacterium]
MAKKSKFVLFDLVGVLIQDLSSKFWDNLVIKPSEQKKYVDSVTQFAQAYEHGELTTNQMIAELQELFEGRYSKKKIRSAILAMRGGPIEGMEDVVQQVSSRCHTTLFSNTNPLHYRQALKNISFLKMLKPHFLSFKIGALKPSPEAYQHVITKLGCEPSELLLIDDSRSNIAGAKACGVKAYLFRDVTRLETQLIKLGIL